MSFVMGAVPRGIFVDFARAVLDPGEDSEVAAVAVGRFLTGLHKAWYFMTLLWDFLLLMDLHARVTHITLYLEAIRDVVDPGWIAFKIIALRGVDNMLMVCPRQTTEVSMMVQNLRLDRMMSRSNRPRGN